MAMTARASIRAGMREVGRRKKIVWTWYGLNLLCSIVIVAPMVMAIMAMLGDSLENQRLFDNFDLSWVTEFGWGAQYEQVHNVDADRGPGGRGLCDDDHLAVGRRARSAA